jgi:hypothetical protein
MVELPAWAMREDQSEFQWKDYFRLSRHQRLRPASDQII